MSVKVPKEPIDPPLEDDKDNILPPEPPQDPPKSDKLPKPPKPTDEERIAAAKAAEEAKKKDEAKKIEEIKRASDAKVFIEHDYEQIKPKLSETVINMIEKHYEGNRNDYVAYEAWIMKVIVREAFSELNKTEVASMSVLNREIIEAVQAGSEYDVQRAYRVWHEMLTNREEAEEKKRTAANQTMKGLTDAQKSKMSAVQIAQHEAANAELKAQEFWKAQRRKARGE